jgi:hypothetical protein
MPIMPALSVSHRLWPLALVAVVACSGSGCTTVLSTASLRDLVLGIDDRVDEGSASTLLENSPSTEDPDGEAADAERRAAAIQEAISRLSKVGTLDDAARATLVATLQRTDQEDWPVVVDAFSESLASEPLAHVVAKTALDTEPAAVEASPQQALEKETTKEPDPVSTAVVAEPAVTAAPTETVASPTTIAPEPPSEPEPEIQPAADVPTDPNPAAPPPPALTIRNANFATRVQAWGVLDRFEADRFLRGQEVIVYFELENLTSGESPAGHTTCIDSRLRLVTKGGDTVHEWTFEPIAETCRARRHDYFARYMVRIPSEAKPGRHQVELTVTDTLSGHEAVEAIDLEILAASHASE